MGEIWFKAKSTLYSTYLDSSSIAQIDLKSSLKPNLSNGIILDVDFVHIIREVNYDKILFKIFRETSNT